MTSCLVMCKIMQTVLNGCLLIPICANACHRISIIRKHCIDDVISWTYTKYYYFFKHEYDVINNVRAYFLWATVHSEYSRLNGDTTQGVCTALTQYKARLAKATQPRRSTLVYCLEYKLYSDSGTWKWWTWVHCPQHVNSNTVKLLIQAESQIEAGSLIQAGGSNTSPHMYTRILTAL